MLNILRVIMHSFRLLLLVVTLFPFLSMLVCAGKMEFLYNPANFVCDDVTVRSAISKLSSVNYLNTQLMNAAGLDSSEGLFSLSAFESRLLNQSGSLSSVPHLILDEIFYDESRVYACAIVHCIFLPSLKSSHSNVFSTSLTAMNHTRVYLMEYDQSFNRWVLSRNENPAYQGVQKNVDIEQAIVVSSDLNLDDIPSELHIAESRAVLVSAFLNEQKQKIDDFREESNTYSSVEVSSDVLLVDGEEALTSPESILARYMYTQKEGDFHSLLNIAMERYRNDLKEQAVGIPVDGVERLMRKAYGRFGETYVLALSVSLFTDSSEFICLLAGKSITGAWNVVSYRVEVDNRGSDCIEKTTTDLVSKSVSSMFKSVFDIWVSEYYRSL